MIELNHISKVFGSEKKETLVNALTDISLKIEDGEFVSVIGKSGSGKTTLLNVMGTLLKPTSGQMLIDGMDPKNLSQDKIARFRNEHIGFVYQAYLLEESLSAVENVALPLMIGGESPKKALLHAEEMLEKVGLLDRRKHKPEELSGGEKQRVAIARAMIKDPSLILADEPTGNLDEETGRSVMAWLRELTKGKKFIMVTHDKDLAMQADRQIQIKDGRLC